MDAGENDSRVVDDTTIDVEAQGPVKFSVWVSFAEIYNEIIYDLLEPCLMGKGKKRTTLRLGDDTNGNPYIKGDNLPQFYPWVKLFFSFVLTVIFIHYNNKKRPRQIEFETKMKLNNNYPASRGPSIFLD